jgi:FkbM family methyltransferase
MRIEPLQLFSGNAFAQRMLSKAVRSLNRMRGIGTGGSARTSGEKALPRLTKRIGETPAIIFDIGANKGQFLDMMRGHFETDKASFHVFEPSAKTFATLSERFAGATNVVLEQQGMGDVSGTQTLYLDREGSELASLTKRNIGYLGHSMDLQELVRITTVDEYCLHRHIERIDLLKIDVEGHELEVLKGAHRMLKEQRVRVVTFEFGGCNIDTRTNLKDFFDLFSEHGMLLHRLTPRGYLCPLKRYRVHEEQYECTIYVALRAGD